MKKRTLFFRIGAIVILLAIAAVMMVIGRGHTVYFDNKKLEYNGETYDTPYKVCVYVNDERVAKLYDKERGMATWIGQNFEMTLEITQEKGGDETTETYQITLPYNMDGIGDQPPGASSRGSIRTRTSRSLSPWRPKRPPRKTNSFPAMSSASTSTAIFKRLTNKQAAPDFRGCFSIFLKKTR